VLKAPLLPQPRAKALRLLPLVPRVLKALKLLLAKAPSNNLSV
jgi:hypothetical protein